MGVSPAELIDSPGAVTRKGGSWDMPKYIVSLEIRRDPHPLKLTVEARDLNDAARIAEEKAEEEFADPDYYAVMQDITQVRE